MSEKKFSGRSAIVTGATRGIGRAIALELAKNGANVAFNYSKSADEAEKLKAEIEASGVKVLAAQCDVANTEAVGEFVKQVKEEFDDGSVDARTGVATRYRIEFCFRVHCVDRLQHNCRFRN